MNKIRIKKSVQIPGTNIILETGDTIIFSPESDEISEQDLDLDEYPSYPMESRKKKKEDCMRRISSELVERKLQEGHSDEIAHDLARVRFDEDDDEEYIAEDIARGIVQGILSNKYFNRRIDKANIIEMISMQLES